MKLTAIKAQIKNPDRVSIYVDGEYSFSLTPNQLLEQKLHSGLEIDEARLIALKQLSAYGKLYDRILRYVMLRPHSSREVQDYCRRKQLDPEACAQIIAKLTEKQYLNDESFAKAWVESRRLTKTISRRVLKLELKQKGVSDEIIAQTLAASPYDEQAALRVLIAKKQRQSRYQDPKKLMQYLVGRGFGYGEVRRELGAASSPQNPDNYPD